MKFKATNIFVQFINSEQVSGIVLIAATLASIGLANSGYGPSYLDFWQTKIGFQGAGLDLKHSIEHWINDGLMAVFFLLIGLEIERELYIGKLASPREASLPAFAALGGMALPALFHYLCNQGTPTQAGIGIPMATDIAFALGVLAMLGDRVPLSLKVFLAAFAVIDDLGAIVLIALFYTQTFSQPYFATALLVFFGLLLFNRFGVRRLPLYLVPGAVMWYCLLKSGVHATLAGVLLAFAIPFCDGDEACPSNRLLHYLHRPVAFVIMPLFALANTGIVLEAGWIGNLATANSIGIFSGLLLGKSLGIAIFSFLAVKIGLSSLPDDLNWSHVLGAGLLGGIGFTMSIFITLLAFSDPGIVQGAKIAVLLSSVAAGTAGFLLLRRTSAGR